jgi:hypothetical protein
MAGHIGWEEFHFGALNVHDGECDLARNLLIWVGIPVCFYYRGAAHRIALANVQDARRRDRLRAFLAEYYRWPVEHARAFRGTVDIPIKARRALGWMAGFFVLLWVSALPGVIGLVAVIALATAQRRVLGFDWWLASLAVASLGLFVAGLLAYRRLRRPSPRQARIRAAISVQLGPFTDLADWKIDSLGPLFPALGIVSLEAADVLADAGALRGAGKDGEALARARAAIALAHRREEAGLIERAELLTDDCLARLEGTAH